MIDYISISRDAFDHLAFKYYDCFCPDSPTIVLDSLDFKFYHSIGDQVQDVYILKVEEQKGEDIFHHDPFFLHSDIVIQDSDFESKSVVIDQFPSKSFIFPLPFTQNSLYLDVFDEFFLTGINHNKIWDGVVSK